MTAIIRCHCDGCGRELPAGALTPVVAMQRAQPAGFVWSVFESQPQWAPVKIGDACVDCLAKVRDMLHQPPAEIEGSVVDRILRDLQP